MINWFSRVFEPRMVKFEKKIPLRPDEFLIVVSADRLWSIKNGRIIPLGDS